MGIEADFVNGTPSQRKAFLADKLAQARERNDSVDNDPAATAALRGEIRCLKTLLGLFDETAPSGIETPGY